MLAVGWSLATVQDRRLSRLGRGWLVLRRWHVIVGAPRCTALRALGLRLIRCRGHDCPAGCQLMQGEVIPRDCLTARRLFAARCSSPNTPRCPHAILPTGVLLTAKALQLAWRLAWWLVRGPERRDIEQRLKDAISYE